MAILNETSEVQLQSLKENIYLAARDGLATGISDILLNLDNDTVAQELLNHHTEEDGQNTTPLIIAARNGKEEVVKLLLDSFCVDIEQLGTVKFDDQIIEGASALWSAAAAEYFSVVKLLVDHGANVNYQTNTGSTPLRAACYSGSLNIVEYLIEHNADFNIKNNYKNTCLMIASFKGHQNVVEFLLRKGADPNFTDKCGSSALHHSAEAGHLSIVKLLNEGGTRFEVKNEDEMTPLMIAAVYRNITVVDYMTSLPECSRELKIEALELLGASFTEGSRYDIELSYRYLRKAMIERYNKNQTDAIKKTPLPPVSAYGNWEECKTLRELEAIENDEMSILMESLTVRERVLGHCHPKVVDAVVYAGALCADKNEYDKCIALWLYGLKPNQRTEYVMRFPESFAAMFDEKENVKYKQVMEVFKHISDELELNMNKIAKADKDESLHKDCQKIVTACVYLIGIMIEINKTDEEIGDLHRAVYKFLQRNPRLQNGFTPLHICCDSVPPADDNDNPKLYDVVKLPNLVLCKTLIACAADINAKDARKNTPLHIIAKCADTVTDVDTVVDIILCLIENGAHLDACNIDGETAIDIATTDIAEAVLKTQINLSLKCLAAGAVKRYALIYEGSIPVSLQKFVELH